MQFKFLSLLTIALSAHQAQAALTPGQIVDKLNEVANISAKTLDAVKAINPSTIIPSGLEIIDGFRQIIGLLEEDIAAMDGSSSGPRSNFSKKDQLNISNAFTSFVDDQQQLLQVIIGQDGLPPKVGSGPAVAAALRSLEAVVDNVAFFILDLVPIFEDEAKSEMKKLDGTFDDAVKKFSPPIPGLLSSSTTNNK